ASLVLPQYPDDLFVCETVALHSLVLSMGQSLLQNGLFQRGKVNPNCVSTAEMSSGDQCGFQSRSSRRW
ncbi:hypothetical protein, partial [Neorhizobium tomejilense]|uniref:hypothetical protein n=1 Tax=Neorhizobium tomejilense TaxID=2093828 RepID=UPI00197BF064